jgi:CheY-like chemotaxis protein
VPDAKPTILIVEDDGDLRRLFCLALKLEGFDVVEAADGYSALMRLESRHVDLVVLDLRLPGVDGFTVYEEIESRGALQHVPVIIVTASIEDLSQVRARVFRKPITAPELVRAIQETLEIRR